MRQRSGLRPDLVAFALYRHRAHCCLPTNHTLTDVSPLVGGEKNMYNYHDWNHHHHQQEEEEEKEQQ